MKRAGGSGLVILAIFLVLLGGALAMGLFDWLLDVIGFLFLAVGVIVGVFGLIQMLSGNKGRSSY